MNSLFNSEEKFNELVFENRNKEYGAYVLRSTYQDTMAKSLFYTLSGIFLLLFSTYLFTTSKTSIAPDTSGNTPPLIVQKVIEVVLPEKKPEQKATPKDPLPPKSTTGAFKPSDEPDKNNNKTNEEMNVSHENNDKGSDSTKPQIDEPPVESTIIELNEVHYYVDQMPEFIGNMNKFISENLRYPQIAVENRTQGTVGISFVVEKDGSVGEVKVLGSVPDGCTEEAVRVISMMPRWKPGKNHGELVRVMFNIPIKFHLAD